MAPKKSKRSEIDELNCPKKKLKSNVSKTTKSNSTSNLQTAVKTTSKSKAVSKTTSKSKAVSKTTSKSKAVSKTTSSLSKTSSDLYDDSIGSTVLTECGPSFKIVANPATRLKNGTLVFEDEESFTPNLTPKEVLQAGSFGGTYFRPIKSGVTDKKYSGVWKELPKNWLEDLDINSRVASSIYDEKVNKYGVKCGGSLQMWEESGWMNAQDAYGWFMWYCRFFRGRRTEDDARQIGRWLRCAGLTGRWRNNLIAKIARAGSTYNNVTISPVVRQTLLHWGYELTEQDYKKGAKKFK